MRRSRSVKSNYLGGIILFGFICALLFSGCGYTTRSMITDKYHNIYVQPFANKVDFTKEEYQSNKYKVYRPFLETDITTAVIDKFLSDGNLRPTQEDLADLVLKGELLEFRRDPLRYDRDQNVVEYRVNIVVNLTLWDRKENKVVWKENNFIGDTTYFTSGPTVTEESNAINTALADLSRRIVERTIENW